MSNKDVPALALFNSQMNVDVDLETGFITLCQGNGYEPASGLIECLETIISSIEELSNKKGFEVVTSASWIKSKIAVTRFGDVVEYYPMKCAQCSAQVRFLCGLKAVVNKLKSDYPDDWPVRVISSVLIVLRLQLPEEEGLQASK